MINIRSINSSGKEEWERSIAGVSGLYQLLSVFATPLTAIMASLLYVKTRKAGGESLRDTS